MRSGTLGFSQAATRFLGPLGRMPSFTGRRSGKSSRLDRDISEIFEISSDCSANSPKSARWSPRVASELRDFLFGRFPTAPENLESGQSPGEIPEIRRDGKANPQKLCPGSRPRIRATHRPAGISPAIGRLSGGWVAIFVRLYPRHVPRSLVYGEIVPSVRWFSPTPTAICGRFSSRSAFADSPLPISPRNRRSRGENPPNYRIAPTSTPEAAEKFSEPSRPAPRGGLILCRIRPKVGLSCCQSIGR